MRTAVSLGLGLVTEVSSLVLAVAARLVTSVSGRIFNAVASKDEDVAVVTVSPEDTTKLVLALFELVDEFDVGDEEGARLTATALVVVEEAMGWLARSL